MREFSPAPPKSQQVTPIHVGRGRDRRETEADTAARAFDPTMEAGNEQPLPPPNIASSAAQTIASGGSSLSASDRAYFEPAFGRDLDRVRVHTDGDAARVTDAIGARAFSFGDHIGFGAGEYSISTQRGRGLLAHELVHALDSSRPKDVLLRKEKPRQPTLEEAETALGTLLRAPPNSSGLTLAFYDQDEPEAQRRAADFAQRESAIGFSGKAPTAHNLEVGKAIPGVFDIDKTVTAIADVAAAALKRVPAAHNLPAESAAAPAKVRTLALFAHGTSGWCSLGVTTSNAGKLFKSIAPRLSTGLAVNIILYTCSSARGSDEDENWTKGTLDAGGKGSLAEKVRDTLADEKIDNATVWGHTTVGHTSRNFALRLFETKDGKGSQGQSFASTYAIDERLRKSATDEMIKAVIDDGFTLDPSDSKVQAKAAEVLRAFVYAGYAEANAKLEGTHPAEDAPVYRYYTANRIEKYWKETYWPSAKESAKKKLIKALKLKKPKALSK